MATNALNNDFLLNIQSVYPSLTKAEKKVADYTLQNSKAVRFLSITDLAEACHVSLTSVFRFCKVLKLQGYQEFKVQLALSMQGGRAGRGDRIVARRGDQSRFGSHGGQKLLQSHINALSETHALVDEAALSRAAHYINHSDQVRFFGVGGSMLTAMEGMYKFLPHYAKRLLLVRYPHADNGRLHAEPTRHRCFYLPFGSQQGDCSDGAKGPRRRGQNNCHYQIRKIPSHRIYGCGTAVRRLRATPAGRFVSPVKRRRCLCWICFYRGVPQTV